MSTLQLTIKKHWFDLIKSGEKTKEYREIKPYWDARLNKTYDRVRFRNGYQTDAPTIIMKCLGITKGYSPVFKTETYIIHLGKETDD